MTIRTKANELPDGFPPARLYLNDIEQILVILKELVRSDPADPKDKPLVTRFTCKNEIADDIQDLPALIRPFSELEIDVASGWSNSTRLKLGPLGSIWHEGIREKERTWSTYNQLAPIFAKRKRHWATFIHSFPAWAWFLVGYAPMALGWATAILAGELSNWIHQRRGGAAAFFVLFYYAVLLSGIRHTIVVPRRSSELSPTAKFMVEKAAAIILTAVLSFLGGALLMYLKYKYFP